MKTLRWLLCSTALTLSAQTNPDARDLLIHSGDSIFESNSVRLTGTVSAIAEGIGPRQTSDSKFSIAMLRDGRGRHESTNGATTDLLVFDGLSLWTYSSVRKNYTKRPVKNLPPSPELSFLETGRNGNNINTATIDRVEDLTLGGKSVPCFVVRAAYKGPPPLFGDVTVVPSVSRTVWISRDRKLVLRDIWEVESTTSNGRFKVRITTDFSSIEIDAPLPDDLFVFHPPEGSHLASGGPGTGTGPGIGGGIGSRNRRWREPA